MSQGVSKQNKNLGFALPKIAQKVRSPTSSEASFMDFHEKYVNSNILKKIQARYI